MQNWRKADASAPGGWRGRDLVGNLGSRHCQEPTGPAFGRPDDKLRDEANPVLLACGSGLLRGACHGARIRATRWLAMTVGARTLYTYGKFSSTPTPSGS